MPRVYESFENSTPFLSGYKQLKIPIISADGVPAWPELFPLAKIEQMRQIVGPRHFSSQMMLEYISEEKARLDPGALHFYADRFDVRTAKLGDALITGLAAYWDPSGGRVQSDSSVCVLIYRDDQNRRVFVHDVRYLMVTDQNLHPLATQCEMVLDFMRAHNLIRIGIEVNGIGNALPEIIIETAKKRSQRVIVQKVNNSRRKETRILDAIEPLLTTGRLYVHESVRSTPLLTEMLGWSPLGTSQHDDGLDALAGALAIPSTPVRSLGQRVRPYAAKTDFQI